MDEFMTEHGGIIVSGLISVITISIILILIISVGNMDAYVLTDIIGG